MSSPKKTSVEVQSSKSEAVEKRSSRVPPPPPLPSVKRRKILSEEDYLEAVDHIIQRDFFPDLNKLRLQKAWLDALDRNDYQTLEEIRTAVAALSGKDPRSIRETPSFSFDTPLRDAEERRNEPIERRFDSDGPQNPSADVNVGLDVFFDRSTSEDNASFNVIMNREEKERKDKIEAMSASSEHSDKKYEKMLQIAASGDVRQIEEFKPPAPVMWKSSSTRSLIGIPEGTHVKTASSSGPPKEILHRGTRFVHTTDEEKARTGSDSGLMKLHSADGAFAGSRQSLGYLSTPSLTPRTSTGQEIDLDDNLPPIVTWGSVTDSPFLLESETPLRASSDNRSFSIRSTSARDQKALELGNSAAGKLRERAVKTGKSPATPIIDRSDRSRTRNADRLTPRSSRTPRSRSAAIDGLSSAGKRLLQRATPTHSSLPPP